MSKLIALEDILEKKDQLLRVEWNIGKRCNYNCSYCGPELHDDTSPYMPVDVFKNTIDQINDARKGKRCKIAFTGGEPFVHPHFIDMLEYCNSLGIMCSVTTNSSLPMKKYEQAIPYLNYIVVSYHFESGYHEKIIDKIVAIHKLQKDMHVHIMFLPGHLEQCKEIMHILDENDIRYVIRRIRPQINKDRTSWQLPYSNGMEGSPPTLEEAKNIQDSYYSPEEIEWLTQASK